MTLSSHNVQKYCARERMTLNGTSAPHRQFRVFHHMLDVAMAQEELDGPCIRQTAIPLEARGVIAVFDTAANRFTIFEELTYDAAGQLLTASLLDYLLPTALDIPTLHLEHMETLSPFTFNGVKGVYLHNQNVVLLLVTLSSFHDTIYSYNRVKPEKSIVVTL